MLPISEGRKLQFLTLFAQQEGYEETAGAVADRRVLWVRFLEYTTRAQLNLNTSHQV